MPDLLEIRATLHEVMSLGSLMTDPTWAWGMSLAQDTVNPAIKAIDAVIRRIEPDRSEAADWTNIELELSAVAERLSASVSILNDDGIRYGTWLHGGDHDF